MAPSGPQWPPRSDWSQDRFAMRFNRRPP
jgi:hypothetical protein